MQGMLHWPPRLKPDRNQSLSLRLEGIGMKRRCLRLLVQGNLDHVGKSTHTKARVYSNSEPRKLRVCDFHSPGIARPTKDLQIPNRLLCPSSMHGHRPLSRARHLHVHVVSSVCVGRGFSQHWKKVLRDSERLRSNSRSLKP